jgi:hypothetical protein
MTKLAKSAFTIDKRDLQPATWEGGQMGRTRFDKTFTGELAGTSVVEAIMLRTDNDGPAVYAGIERFDCTLEGRKGTFLLLHAATMRGSHQDATWKIVSGSGTGELAGIHGHGEIHPNHDFILTYQLET